MAEGRTSIYLRRAVNAGVALLPLTGVLALGWKPAAVMAYFLLEYILVLSFALTRCVIGTAKGKDDDPFKFALMGVFLLIVGAAGAGLSLMLSRAWLGDLKTFAAVFTDQSTLWAGLVPALGWHGWLFWSRFIVKGKWKYNDPFHYLAYPMGWAAIPPVLSISSLFVFRAGDIGYAAMSCAIVATLELTILGYMARQYYDEVSSSPTDLVMRL